MTAPATQQDTMHRAREAICLLLMPFFLLGAGDDPEKARAAVDGLIQAYDPRDTKELDLVARIIGFSAAALDNLRLSMGGPSVSDTKILRYRSAAVSLSRSAEQCRVVLRTVQSQPQATVHDEKPAIAPRPPAPVAKSPAPAPHLTPAQTETAKTEVRALLAELAKSGAARPKGLTALRVKPDQGALLSAAVTAAVAAKQTEAATQDPNRHR
jgi:hypothetical protein